MTNLKWKMENESASKSLPDSDCLGLRRRREALHPQIDGRLSPVMSLMVERGDQDVHPRHFCVEERNLFEHFRFVQSGDRRQHVIVAFLNDLAQRGLGLHVVALFERLLLLPVGVGLPAQDRKSTRL